jgi:hypothetical protein
MAQLALSITEAFLLSSARRCPHRPVRAFPRNVERLAAR